MNIVFFGTSEFAIPSLRELLVSRHKVLAVVTQPDRKKGRELKLSPPPAKVLALSHGIPVCQPQNASSAETIMYLKGLAADFFVVVSFGQILKKELLAVPKIYAVNVHGSLLPKYRGAAPTNWAMLSGDASSGVTIMKMSERLDAGEIIAQKNVVIDDEDTNITLSEELSELGAKALVETLDAAADGKKIDLIPQDDSLATYAPKLKKEDGLIDWNESAAKIRNKVRALIPWPGAYTRYDGNILKILKTDIVDVACGPGVAPAEVVDIVKGRGIFVKAGTGVIAITHLQLEGKKILDADAFLRGHPIVKGYRFGC
jgi:methionyl-tRNA formyltransferase